MKTDYNKWCIFLRSLPIGGVERQFSTLVNLLATKREVHLVTLYDSSDRAAELLDDTVEYAYLCNRVDRGKTPPGLLLLAPIRLREYCKANQITVLYSARDLANLIAALACLRLPKVRLLWGHRSSKHNLSWRIRALLPLCRMVQGGVYCEVSNNFEGIAFYRSLGLCRGKTKRVVNFLDRARFSISEGSRAKMRHEWGERPETVLVGLVGRVAHMKNQDGFLRAASLVAPIFPGVKFYVIGPMTPSARASIEQQASSLSLRGRVIVKTEVDMQSMPGVFNALDVICSTSLYGEGFCNTLAEAMACGCRAIGTDIGATREIISDSGEVVTAGDDEAYAAALIKTLNGLKGGRSVKARAHILSICDDDSTLREVMDLGEVCSD